MTPALSAPQWPPSLSSPISVPRALSHAGAHLAHSILARALVHDTGFVRARKTLSGALPLRLPTAFVDDNLYFGKLVGRYARTRSNPGLAAACWEGPWIPGRTVPNRPRSRVCFTWQVPPFKSLHSRAGSRTVRQGLPTPRARRRTSQGRPADRLDPSCGSRQQ